MGVMGTFQIFKLFRAVLACCLCSDETIKGLSSDFMVCFLDDMRRQP